MPGGWRWERIEDVAPVNPKRKFGSTSDDEPMAFVPMAAVAEESGKIDVSQSRPAVEVRKGYTRFQSGDVIFAKITPCMENGKIAVIPELRSSFGTGSTEFHVLAPERVEARFLFYWLSQRQFRQEAEFNMTGTAGQKRVPLDYLRNASIPVPPSETQRRIVARIDELFSELDDGEEELARARADLETYRKALLKAAVTGELTADWREGNAPEGDGTAFLSQLRANREPPEGRRRPRSGRTSSADPAILPTLSESWAWATLGQLMTHIEAGLNVKAQGRPPEPGETGIVKISAVTWDEFDETESKTLFADTAIREANLIRPGDLLLSRANTLELVGAPAIVGHIGRRLVISDKVLRLHVDETVKRWVYYVLKSPLGRKQIEAAATGNQLSMRNISQDSLRALAIPLPPRLELDEMMSRIDAGWLGHIDMKEALEETDASTLRQSILAAAFRGELVQ
nr:restriction endonuclease subunit S [Hephaestia sp. MAHUQ-44]